MLKRWYKNIVNFVKLFFDYIKERNELIEKLKIAQEESEKHQKEIDRLIALHNFELKAEMSTKIRVWLKDNRTNVKELLSIVEMSSDALSKAPKKEYDIDREGFDRDYRDLQPSAGLSKSRK